MKDKIVFVSDIHMEDPDFPPSQKQKFMDFLENYVKENAQELYLLGDIFELSQGKMIDVLESNLDFLLKFVELANSGTKITYLLGNHDYTFSDVTGFNILPHPNIKIVLSREQAIPVRNYVGKGGEGTEKVQVKKIPTSGFFITLHNKNLFLAHGHEFNHYFRGNPNRFKTVIRASRALERISPTLDEDALAGLEKMKKTLFSIFYNNNTPAKAKIEKGELEFLLAARDICKYKVLRGQAVERTDEDRIDYVIFGHTHVQMVREAKDDVLRDKGKVWGTYVNTGAWVIKGELSDYTVLNPDGTIAQGRWPNQPEC